ncbi:hypothetical protein ACFL1B_04385 [Nanoarchaeota archaeon]
MAGNNLEQEIIALYNKDITALHSINQIAATLGKAYPYINKKATSLIKSRILNKTVIGRSHLCSINLASDEATWMLILNEIKARQRAEESDPHLTELLSRIQEVSKVVTIYSVVKIGKRLVFVLENIDDKAILEKSVSINSYKLECCTKREFLEMLIQDEKLLKERVILFSYEYFYQCMKEVEPQIRIKYSLLLK